MTSYDTTFYKYVNSGSIKSAEHLLPFLTQQFEINSVLDVGCGQGAWLSVWENLGVKKIAGIDGDYVERARLLVDEESFIPRNLSEGFDLGMRFDLVQSLEVAEHLPEKSAAHFVASLVKHGNLIFFSAAAKGDGGHDHVNEQDYDYWRSLFNNHGYIAIDYIRPLILEDKDIEPWYRYNCFLYISENLFNSLPSVIQASRVAQNQKLQDLSPISWKFRKAIVQLLPVPVMNQLARIKEKYIARVRGYA